MSTKVLNAGQIQMLQHFTEPFMFLGECSAEAAIRRIGELERENERLRAMFFPTPGSWFWKNCKSNRRRGDTKCCAECPFRAEILAAASRGLDSCLDLLERRGRDGRTLATEAVAEVQKGV